MVSLCNKYGNELPGFNHIVLCNPGFTCVKSADKIALFSELMQTT